MLLLLTMQVAAQTVPVKELNFLYKAGEAGYSCFRIPAIVATTKGTLLAFAEARKNGCGDAGNIDLVVKRSNDNGKTWSSLQMVWDDSTNTCGNPVPIIDRKTGNIILLSTWNLGTDHEKDIIAGRSKDTRRVFVLSSKDDGLSWSSAKEITKNVKHDNWTWYATGPGSAIQIQKGGHKGRLIVSTNHVEDTAAKRNYVQAIYSDNHGKSWKLGGITRQDSMNESTIAELSDGRLMVNIRNASKKRTRQVAISDDAGASWSDVFTDTVLIEPVCQANLISFITKDKRHALAFSNPASRTARTAMTARISYDDGKTWAYKKLLYNGPSAYSNMIFLPNGNLGCFYEAGYAKPYEGIVFEDWQID
ncbi:MAG: sialidase family protein [Bacteroidota bacterium]